MISVDPQIAAALNASTAISRKLLKSLSCILIHVIIFLFIIIETNGSGVSLLKLGSKRRRSKLDMDAERLEARTKEEAIQ